MNTFTTYLNTTKEIGFVDESVPSLAYISGLPGVKTSEIIVFESGEMGYVTALLEELVEVLVFAKSPVRLGTRAARTGHNLQIPVGEKYLGKIIDPFGNLVDKSKTFQKPTTFLPIDSTPLGIEHRQKIINTFETGVSLVDTLIPLGKGQRELVLGDRKTGKTNFLYQTMIHQAKKGVVCIYAVIGKRKFDIKHAEDIFQKAGIMDKTVIMASLADDPLASIYVTPYCAMTLAEYFRDNGKDVLLILDDLTNHAKFYREVGLLGKRFPGRNAYPGDIFFAHARLLERAGNFVHKDGEASITCLPVVETVQGDIAGYIQTNIMSMTDGHIYFDTDLFTRGRRPAINHALSVTRVGRQTQTDLRRSVSRELTSFLTLLEKMENFSHFGAEASFSIKETLATGEQLGEFFNQTADVVIEPDLQIFIFTLLWYGVWKGQYAPDMKADISKIITQYRTDPALQKQVSELIKSATTLNEFMNVLRTRITDLVGYLKLEHANMEMISLTSPATSNAKQPNQSSTGKEENEA